MTHNGTVKTYQAPESESANSRSDSWLRVGLFFWFVLVAVWLTWTPFDFTAHDTSTPTANPTSLVEILGNLVLLLPIGFVLGHSARVRNSVLRALAAGLAISVALEVGQAFLPGRIVSMRDILLNTTGAGIGVVLAARTTDRYGMRRPLILLATFVYALIGGHAIYAGSEYGRRMRLSSWRPPFEILAGDEFEADRRYQGKVSAVQICGGVKTRVCATPGADEEQRRQLVRAAETEQAVDVYAKVQSSSDTQIGPTRIATFSNGPLERNITVGQLQTNLVIRIRTRMMGPNGRNVELIVPDVMHAGVLNDLHVSYRPGTIRTELSRNGETFVAEHRFGALSSGLMFSGLARVTPEATRRTRRVMALVLLTGPAVILGTQFGFLVQLANAFIRRRNHRIGNSSFLP